MNTEVKLVRGAKDNYVIVTCEPLPVNKENNIWIGDHNHENKWGNKILFFGTWQKLSFFGKLLEIEYADRKSYLYDHVI